MKNSTCSVDGCERADMKRDWCKKHYNQGLIAGVIAPLPRLSFEQRFWMKADKSGECWEWKSSIDKDGYGHFLIKKRGKNYAEVDHRIAYELTHGPIPEGMKIDHRCHNRSCVNPSHLRVVTHKQNLENRVGAQRNNLSSGVRGVSRYRDGTWRAYVRHNKVDHHLGYFERLEDAEAAAIAKRLELFTHNDVDQLFYAQNH